MPLIQGFPFSVYEIFLIFHLQTPDRLFLIAPIFPLPDLLLVILFVLLFSK